MIEGNALICFILNAGSIGGVLGISLPPVGDVNISDGYLDLYAVTKGVQPLRAITHHLFNIGESQAGIYHWRGKEITLEADTSARGLDRWGNRRQDAVHHGCHPPGARDRGSGRMGINRNIRRLKSNAGNM